MVVQQRGTSGARRVREGHIRADCVCVQRQSLYIQHADLRRNVAHTLIVRGNDPPPPPGRWYNRLGFADWVVLGIVAASMWLVLLGTLWLIGSEMEKSTERRRYWELRDHQEL